MDKVSKEIADFFRSSSLFDQPESEDYLEGIILGNGDEGPIELNRENTRKYRECLGKLIEVISDDKISPRAIEKFFQKAILNINSDKYFQDESHDQRIDRVMRELRQNIEAKAICFEVYIPVSGLANEMLPKKIGKVTFCVFDDSQSNRFRKIIDSRQNSESQKKKEKDGFERFISRHRGKDGLDKDDSDRTMGLIEVFAVDSDAARNLALKEIRLTLDVLNFYSDLIPFSSGHIFLPGDTESTSIRILTLEQDKIDKPSYSLSGSAVGPIGAFSLKRLADVDGERDRGFTKVKMLLEKDRNRLGKLEERLISAIQWSGRAAVDSRTEEAFLLYAIALESIILAESDKNELTYRLGVRVAHLLGSTLESRRKYCKEIKELYGIRSEIVHNGAYEVIEQNVNLIRAIVKKCILRLLTDEPFVSMTDPKDLVNWFDEQILK